MDCGSVATMVCENQANFSRGDGMLSFRPSQAAAESSRGDGMLIWRPSQAAAESSVRLIQISGLPKMVAAAIGGGRSEEERV